MADKSNKQPLNVPGKFFVDTECIDCDVCRQTAPNYFKANEEDGYSYVYKQPETEQGREECEEALEACPVEAIGRDGDKA